MLTPFADRFSTSPRNQAALPNGVRRAVPSWKGTSTLASTP